MPTALVVDDSAMDQKLIGGILQRRTNCEVTFASNGSEAMSCIQDRPIDVVLTDLQMPEMDGLNLVQAIRIQYADLPVILITGQGSEDLATEALERGAASYVPKSRLAEMLADTVEDVLAVVRADRGYASLIGCMIENQFRFELPNDPELVDPLVDLVQQMVSGVGLCDAIERVRVGIAVEQALLNALYRGNLEISAEQMQLAREEMLKEGHAAIIEQRRTSEPYSSRKIYVDVQISAERAEIVIRDEGDGFDTAAVPAAGDPSALEREGGRGLVLMHTFMDDVKFNQQGNEVTMIKYGVNSSDPAD